MNQFKQTYLDTINYYHKVYTDFKRKSLYRKKMMNMLTIQEAELIYKSFINKRLYVYHTDFVTKKKIKKDIPFWKLKLKIKMKVDNEKIIYCVPRFEEIKQ